MTHVWGRNLLSYTFLCFSSSGDMVLVHITRFDMCSDYMCCSQFLARVISTIVHFVVQAPPATRSCVCRAQVVPLLCCFHDAALRLRCTMAGLMSWRQGCSDVLVEPMLVSLDKIGSLLAACSLHYLSILHWPTHRGLSKEALDVLGASWAFARNSPRDMYLRNNRCVTCGWLTGRIVCGDEPRCGECYNTCVCIQCTYQVGGQLRCLQCDMLPEHCRQSDLQFVTFMEHVGDRLDALSQSGMYHPKNVVICQKVRIFKKWKQWAIDSILLGRSANDAPSGFCLRMQPIATSDAGGRIVGDIDVDAMSSTAVVMSAEESGECRSTSEGHG